MTNLPAGPKQPALIQLYHWLNNTLPWLDRCAATYGDTFTMRLPGNPPFVITSNPDYIKAIFTADPAVLYAGEANQFLESIAGKNSIMLQDGESHLRQRKLLLPPFHGERMQAYGDTMIVLTHQMLDSWQPGPSKSVLKEMREVTLKVIIRTIFGIGEGERFDEMKHMLTRLSQAMDNPFSMLFSLLLKPATLRALSDFSLRKQRLAGFTFQLGKLLPWYSLASTLNELNELLYAEFARRRVNTAERGVDILSLLLEARHEDGSALSDVELRDQLITLLTAGHETTTTAISWVFYHLLKEPAVERRVRDELTRITEGRPLQVSHLTQLEFLDATIKEAMRMYPVAHTLFRKVKQPFRLGDHEIPAGAYVAPNIYLTHRNPHIYSKPLQFKPERFQGNRYSASEYMPYGGGTRRCLGAAFAHYEMKLILAVVLQRVDFSSEPSVKVSVGKNKIFLAPSHGMPIKIDTIRASV
jgi:cytochrome P450 family 110